MSSSYQNNETRKKENDEENVNWKFLIYPSDEKITKQVYPILQYYW